MLSSELILINKFAQGKVDLEEVLIWFDSLNEDGQLELISLVNFCLYQSHPSEMTIRFALDTLFIKPTTESLEMLAEYDDHLLSTYKVMTLPDNEYRDSFITMLHVFKVSDTERRNNYCKNDCSHEWHNLNMKNFISYFEYLIEKGKIWLRL